MAPRSASVSTHEQRALANGLNAFGMRLLHSITVGESMPDSGNVVVSGLSLGIALLMTYWGARGETASEIATLIGLDGGTNWHAAARSLSSSLMRNDHGPTVRLANALWARRGYNVRPEFVAECADALETIVESLDFESPAARERINDWVAEQTRDAIPELLPYDIHPLTVLFITNALYFAGQWASPFDAAETQPAPFTCWDGQMRDVPMMRRQAKMAYWEDEQLQAVRLPFIGDALCLDVILPQERGDLPALLQDMDGSQPSAAWRYIDRQGVLAMPRLDLACTWHMGETLRQLGMRQAFSASQADFYGISENALIEGLYVSRVQHNTRFQVDESGAVAAAASAVEFRLRGLARPLPPFEMIVDHPFLFLLRDLANGAVLMQGVVGNPSP